MSQPQVRVIVAEDDALVARDIQETVEELGYQVAQVVGSGPEAVRAAEVQRPDLALLDIRMPGSIDGVGAGREIMRGLGIPVVFLTAYGDRGTVDRAMAESPFAYVLKPFDRQELRAAIEVALHRAGLERELRASEERFASTLRSVREGVVATDASGRVNFVNPEAERLTGWSFDEAVGREVEDVVRFELDADDQGAPHRVRQVLDDQVSRSAPRARLLHRAGNGTAVSDSIAPVVTRAGELLGAVTVVRDETEAVARARELRETERRFRQIADSIGDVFWISSADKKRVEYVSPAFEKIWGRPAEDLLGDAALWLRMVVPEDREGLVGTLDRQAAGGWEQEYRIRRPDGEIRWIRDRAFPVPGEDGRIAGVAQDVTSRRVAEERFGLLSEHIRDVVLVLDRDGKVKFTSKSVAEATGYAADALTGSDIYEIVHPEDRDRLREDVDRMTSFRGVNTWTACRILTRSGDVRVFESIASNRLDHPGIEGIVMVSRDVTERLALEERVGRASKMEAVGRLAGGVAHDFNNLLTVIRTQAELLILDLDPPPSVREEIELIASTASRAAELTTQLLAFGRGQVLRPQVVNLNDVLRDMMRLLTRTLGTHIGIATSLSPDLAPISIDKGQLEQVVMNLALNARDAMPGGGKLSFKTLMVNATDSGKSEPPAEPRVRLLVADDGVGMDVATRERIFEPFFTTKEHRGGTGLGLASCHGIVEQSGGSMRVESSPGAGTTFILDFPATRARPEAKPRFQPTRDAGDPASLEVLVVEDDPHVLRAVERTLRRHGFGVTSVAGVQAALRILDEAPHRFGCVLTDLVLSGQSARPLIEYLLEECPEIPVIATSGYADGSPGTRRGLPEEVHFVRKPFTPDELVSEVRRAVHGD